MCAHSPVGQVSREFGHVFHEEHPVYVHTVARQLRGPLLGGMPSDKVQQGELCLAHGGLAVSHALSEP